MDYNKFCESYRKNHEQEINIHTEELLQDQERRKQQAAEFKTKFKRRASDNAEAKTESIDITEQENDKANSE